MGLDVLHRRQPGTVASAAPRMATQEVAHRECRVAHLPHRKKKEVLLTAVAAVTALVSHVTTDVTGGLGF